MQATLVKTVQANGKPVQIIFETYDPEMMNLTLGKVALLQAKPVELEFRIALEEDEEPQRELPFQHSPCGSDNAPRRSIVGEVCEAMDRAEGRGTTPAAPVKQDTKRRCLYAALHQQPDANEFITELCSRGRLDIEIADAIQQLFGEDAASGEVEGVGWVSCLMTDDEGSVTSHLYVSEEDITGDDLLALAREVLEIPHFADSPEAREARMAEIMQEVEEAKGSAEVDMDRANAENALYDALMGIDGAKERWSALVAEGATDDEIGVNLVAELTGGQEDDSGNWAGVDGYGPFFMPAIGERIGGSNLISTVRAILNIPYPEEEPETACGGDCSQCNNSECLTRREAESVAEPATSLTIEPGNVITRNNPKAETALILVDSVTPDGNFWCIDRNTGSEKTPDCLAEHYRVVNNGELIRHKDAPQEYRLYIGNKVELWYPGEPDRDPLEIAKGQLVNYVVLAAAKAEKTKEAA